MTLKENPSEKEKTDLLQELNVMKNLGTHPNVVRLIACCTDKEPTLVLMDFVSLGKLQQFLRDSRAERHYGDTHGGSQLLTFRDSFLLPSCEVHGYSSNGVHLHDDNDLHLQY